MSEGSSASARVEAAAQELYATGPWGEMDRFLDGGVRCSTDSHSMEVYRAIVRTVLNVAPDTPSGEERLRSRVQLLEAALLPFVLARETDDGSHIKPAIAVQVAGQTHGEDPYAFAVRALRDPAQPDPTPSEQPDDPKTESKYLASEPVMPNMPEAESRVRKPAHNDAKERGE